MFWSGQCRQAKSDPAIFLQCLGQLGATPAQALFIDDKAENAEAARRAGLRAHHYTGMPALQAWLHGHGLPDRKRAVSGERVSGRVELGGRRKLKKKNKPKDTRDRRDIHNT